MKYLCQFLVCLFLGGLALFSGCTPDPSEVRLVDLQRQYLDAAEIYLRQIEDAETSEEILVALNRFMDKADRLLPAITEKSQSVLTAEKVMEPEELELQKKYELLAGRLGMSCLKVIRYLENPEVKAAQRRLLKLMQEETSERTG